MIQAFLSHFYLCVSETSTVRVVLDDSNLQKEDRNAEISNRKFSRKLQTDKSCE